MAAMMAMAELAALPHPNPPAGEGSAAGAADVAARERRPVDIEILVQWVLEPRQRLPFDRAGERELAFDKGLTVKPRRREPGSWALAEACAGLRFGNGRALPALPTAPRPDADTVIAAIRRLAPATAATVIACARGKIRPDWDPAKGVEPVQIEKRRHRCRLGGPRVRIVWKPCTPEEICAAREIYRRWHDALAIMAVHLEGVLEDWKINGFAAPAEPWADREAAARKIA